MFLFIKRGQVYPVPPSLYQRLPCVVVYLLRLCQMALVGGCMQESELSGGVGWSVVALACLPEEVSPHAIFPLGPLHTDPVRWHPGSSYAVVGGAHQSDHNTTLDVYALLRAGLFPLGGQETD